MDVHWERAAAHEPAATGLLSKFLSALVPQRHADQDEEPIRYEDFDEEDLPRWPGQWRHDEIIVLAPNPVVEEIQTRFNIPFSAIESLIRRGQYAIRQPARGLEQGLNRGMVVIMLPASHQVLRLRVNFSWDDDGRPILGILGLRQIDPARYTREDVISLAQAAQKSLSAQAFSAWYEDFLHHRPACALRSLCSRDKAYVKVFVRLPNGQDVNVAIIGVNSPFYRMPTAKIAESAEFWTWLDERIGQTKEWAARVKHHRHRTPQGDQAQWLLEGNIELTDIQAVRIMIRRSAHAFDFLLWERT